MWPPVLSRRQGDPRRLQVVGCYPAEQVFIGLGLGSACRAARDIASWNAGLRSLGRHTTTACGHLSWGCSRRTGNSVSPDKLMKHVFSGDSIVAAGALARDEAFDLGLVGSVEGALSDG
jgi:hypothetical protein